jgi:multisubunit Na+/H+ antiporter MnhC subunit
VVLLVAALILTAAVIVIGVTALRVTSADDGAGFDRSGQASS